VDAIKIDRALVSGIDSDSRQRAIGCDFVQGHFFSPPLPSAQMRAWLRQ
jgi:EAL domain-containing protein (putative c-di-GMP-specific phosphodiesterase class I)